MSAESSCYDVLKKLGGEKDVKVSGSREWRVDFFSKSYPPLAAEFLYKKDQLKLPEKLVKLMDIRKFLDARGILIVSPGSIDPQDLQVATSLEIYVVMSNDGSSLWEAVKGGDLSEINRIAMSQAMATRKRSMAQACRSAILELIGEKWLTSRELEDQLRWRYVPKTVVAQIKSLQRRKSICVLGRNTRGEGILGIPGKIYPLRSDLSGPSRIFYLTKSISGMLESERGHPLEHAEIAVSLGISKHAAAAVLRELSKQGRAFRTKNGWVAKNKPPSGAGT